MRLEDELYRMEKRLPKYYLYQKDFDRGTVRILKPGNYIFCEDIIFEPNIKNGCLPYAIDKQYSTDPFRLGFFAAITVESCDVVINLNGHTLKQGPAHMLLQAFYSHIELCNTPFIPKQGPADFSKHLVSANRVVIKNGCLGISSHHAIHGNGASKVLITNLRIEHFTVAAIALNGGYDIKVKQVRAGPNRHNIPVLGTYSQANFAVQLSQQFMTQYSSQLTYEEKNELITATAELNENIMAVYHEILETGQTSDLLYRNDDGLIDGNCYGMLIHPLGMAVNEFVRKTPCKQRVKKVWFEEVKIFGIKNRIKEVVAVSENPDVAVDTAGAVFQFDRVSYGDRYPSGRRYKGNKLSRLQIILADCCRRLNIKYGTINISQNILDWAKYGKYAGAYNLHYKCDGDAMFHLNKGAVGLRLDGIEDARFSKIYIHDVSNDGLLGNTVYCGKYQTSHDAQVVPGYHGADATGVNISDCHGLYFGDSKISKVIALNGTARAIRVMFDSCEVAICNVKISCIKSGCVYRDGKWYGITYYEEETEYTDELPNGKPSSYGIELYQTDVTHVRDVKITKLSGPRIEEVHQS